MLKKILYGIQLTLLVVAVLGVYGFSNYKNDQREPEEIEISFVSKDNVYLDVEIVNKLLKQKFDGVLNQAKDALVLNRLEKILSEIPLVEQAQVYVTVTGELKADIAQKQPIARVVNSDQVFYLDRLGGRMPLSKLHSARVPLITGKSSDLDLKNCKHLLEFAAKDDFLKDNLVGIDVEQQGKYVLELRSDDLKVRIGTVEDLALKMAKLKAFYNKALKDSMLMNYRLVDVSFNHQVVAKKR